MPSTITTYSTFVAGTKAKSSEVNANFSNYRGDIVPINEATITASNNTHYLGATDHYWAGLYTGQIDFITSTTTATLVLKGDTTNTTGAFLFQIEGTTRLKSTVDGIEMSGNTSTVNPIFKINQAITTGAMDLLFGTNTITSWDSGGLQRASIDVGFYTTVSAPIGKYVLTGVTTLIGVGSSSATGQTISVNRIQTRGSGVVSFRLFKGGATGNGLGLAGIADAQFSIDLYRGITTTALSLINTHRCPHSRQQYGTSANVYLMQTNIDFEYIDSSYSAGEVVYQTIVRSSIIPTTTADCTFSLTAAIFIKEL